MKVLVLEDDEILLGLMESRLKEENYEVDSFSDGEKALDSISDGYSCFILDINVPSLDGITLLKNIIPQEKQTTFYKS